MDPELLYQQLKDNLFTDLNIEFVDSVNKININVHRNILYASCEYFRKILTTNFREKDSNKIIIEISNAFVAYDIILSFYGRNSNIGNLPEWQHSLESIKCCDYFGMNHNLSLLTNLEIPKNDVKAFELLLDVIELVGYTEQFIRLIINHMPKNYDISVFSPELQKEISNANNAYQVAVVCTESIHIWDLYTEQKIKTINMFSPIISVCYSPDGKYLAFTKRRKIIILDTKNFEIIRKIEYNHIISHICFTPDSKFLISGDFKLFIHITDMTNGNIVSSFAHGSPIGSGFMDPQISNPTRDSNLITCIACSRDGKYFATGCSQGFVNVWEINTWIEKFGIYHGSKITSIYFSDKFIFSGDRNGNLKVFEIASDTKNLLADVGNKNASIYSIFCTLDDKNVIICRQNGQVDIYDIDNGITAGFTNMDPEVYKSLISKEYSQFSFTPCGQYITSIINNGTVNITNVNTGKIICSLNHWIRSINHVCWKNINNPII